MVKVYNKDRFGNTIDLDTMLKKFKKLVEKDETMYILKRKEFFYPKSIRQKMKRDRLKRIMKKR